MQIAWYLVSLIAPLCALAIPAPKGGGGTSGGGFGGFGGFRGFGGVAKGSGTNGGSRGGGGGGSYHGHSWSGSSFATGAFTGYLGGVYVGHGPFRGGADGHHYGREPPPDCVVAKALSNSGGEGAPSPPEVDCYYTWEHWYGDNFLLYVIRIAASGQEVKGWSKGVVDNIKGECGNHMMSSSLYTDTDWYWHANEDYGKTRHVNGTSFHGLEMTVPISTWSPGEDEKSCVTEAIRKASCGVDLNFTKGACYRKPGTSKAPWTFKELGAYDV